MSDQRRRVLVLGGGVAGLQLATRLGRARARNALDVTLADRSLANVWKPMLHTFATPKSSDIVSHSKGNAVQYRRSAIALTSILGTSRSGGSHLMVEGRDLSVGMRTVRVKNICVRDGRAKGSSESVAVSRAVHLARLLG